MCGLAYFCLITAREIMRLALSMYDDNPIDHLHHRLTVFVLSPNGALRADVILFIRGGQISLALALLRAKLMLVDTVERKAETPHSIAKQARGYHKGGPLKISTSLRMGEPFEHLLLSTPDAFLQISDEIARVRSPKNIASVFALWFCGLLSMARISIPVILAH
jgi:hypothetical protein